MWPGHRIQIGAYALLLEEKFKIPVEEGFVHYLDGKEKRHISINPFLKDDVKRLVREVNELIENKNLPDYCNNKNKCSSCGLNSICYNDEELSVHLKKAEIEI